MNERIKFGRCEQFAALVASDYKRPGWMCSVLKCSRRKERKEKWRSLTAMRYGGSASKLKRQHLIISRRNSGLGRHLSGFVFKRSPIDCDRRWLNRTNEVLTTAATIILCTMYIIIMIIYDNNLLIYVTRQPLAAEDFGECLLNETALLGIVRSGAHLASLLSPRSPGSLAMRWRRF